MMALNEGGYRRDTWTSGICVLMFVYYYMFKFFNNPLESTCTILGRICVFLFPKALAFEHVHTYGRVFA